MWSRNMMLMQVSYVTKQRFHSLNIGNYIKIFYRHYNLSIYMDCFSSTSFKWMSSENNSKLPIFRNDYTTSCLNLVYSFIFKSG